MGELGIMFARLKTINNSIESVGGNIIPTSDSLWSSSEYEYDYAWFLDTYNGGLYDGGKNDSSYGVRSFALLD
jgi:hypothetical protein